MSPWERLRAEIRLIYEDLLHTPPMLLLAISCLALIFAATIAFGIRP